MPAGHENTATPEDVTALTGLQRQDLDAAANRMSKMALYWLLAAVFMFLDTMATYFARTLTGAGFPYSMLVFGVFLFGLLRFGFPKFDPPVYASFALYFLILAFSVSIITLEEFELSRFRNLLGALVAFAIGYGCFRAAIAVGPIRFALFFVGGLYAVVCFIAVLKIYPALFPVIDTLGFRQGKWIYRPEVTTDQNFQIFYLIPIALLLALRNSTLMMLLIFSIAGLSAFVLAELQTRSGSLVLGATLVMSALVGMRSRSSIDYRLAILAFLGVVLSLVFLDKIVLIFQNLIERFTVSDFDTLEKRTSAFLFTFTHLFDFDWWLPRGYQAYRLETGFGKPHSNITAILVETGVLGLIGWVFAFVVPLFALAKRWLRRRSDEVSDIALCGGVTAMVSQLSLNAPLVEIVWFWCGAVLAALARPEVSREEPASKAKEAAPPWVRSPTSSKPPPKDIPATPVSDERPKAPAPRKLEPGRPAARPAGAPAPTPTKAAPRPRKLSPVTPRKLSDTAK